MPVFSSSPLGLIMTHLKNPTINKIGGYDVIGTTNSTVKDELRSLFSNDGRIAFSGPGDKSFDGSLSTTSLIEYSESYPGMKLKYSDFAYLKNLGVYPNNRLVIARRFASPVDNDLTTIQSTPISTLISWVPDNQDFIKATEFGEAWDEGEASFKDILNDIGKDVMMGDNRGKKLGDFVESAANSIPLPGFTEALQWQLFNSLGMTELDSSNFPLGNPNIIKESKKRKIYAKDSPSSGLKCKFSVEMAVEYEQKFINGIDPTIVYYDIIANALAFGTSESQFLFKSNVGDKMKVFLDNLSSGDPARIKNAMVQFIQALADAVGKVAKQIIDAFRSTAKKAKEMADKLSNPETKDKPDTTTGETYNSQMTLANSVEAGLKSIVYKLLQGLINKYKIRIVSVVNALTGSPSAPWHVTIGDPRNPIFCSGDMLVDGVKISMGKVLAFNNLPASIKLEFTLTSARNLGAQEIYNRFNCGQGRTYKNYKKSFVETDISVNEKESKQLQNDAYFKDLRTNAKVKMVNGNYSTNEIAEKGKLFPSGITSLSSTKFSAPLSGEVFAMANIVLRDSLGAPMSTATALSFYPDGSLYDSAASKKIGSWSTDEKGNVTMDFIDKKYKNGQTLVAKT